MKSIIDFRLITLIVIDVDGTLTDGSIYYDSKEQEIKKFNTKDGTGILAALSAGIEVMILSGRESKAVERRAKELGVSYLIQNVHDKEKFIMDYMHENGLKDKGIAYIGDDLNDYWAMKKVGFIACPHDADSRVKCIADFIADADGGYGAVRESIFYILEKRNQLEEVLYNISH